MRSVYLDLLSFLRSKGLTKLTNYLFVKHNFYKVNLAHIAFDLRDKELIELAIKEKINFNQENTKEKTPLSYFLDNPFEYEDLKCFKSQLLEIEDKIGYKLISKDNYSSWDALNHLFHNFERELESVNDVKKTKEFAELFLFLLERTSNYKKVNEDFFIEMIWFGYPEVLNVLNSIFDSEDIAKIICATSNQFLPVREAFRKFNLKDAEKIYSFLISCDNFNEETMEKKYCEWYDLYESDYYSLNELLNGGWFGEHNREIVDVFKKVLTIKEEKEELSNTFANIKSRKTIKV